MEVLYFIFNLYMVTVLGSLGIKMLKEYRANKRIEKQGLEIINGEREWQEIVYDCMKEYVYTLVPIRNVKKTWKLIWGNNKKYAEAKLAKLKEQGRIKEAKVEESVVEQPKPKKEEKVVTTQSKKPEKLVVDEFINQVNESKDIEFITSVKTTYRKKSIELRERFAKLQELHKNTSNAQKKSEIKDEMSSIRRRVTAYDEIFVAARDRIAELKQNQPARKK